MKKYKINILLIIAIGSLSGLKASEPEYFDHDAYELRRKDDFCPRTTVAAEASGDMFKKFITSFLEIVSSSEHGKKQLMVFTPWGFRCMDEKPSVVTSQKHICGVAKPGDPCLQVGDILTAGCQVFVIGTAATTTDAGRKMLTVEQIAMGFNKTGKLVVREGKTEYHLD